MLNFVSVNDIADKVKQHKVKGGPYLSVSPVCGVEAGLAVGRGKGVPRPSRIPAAQIAIEVGPENAADAVESHRIDAGIHETANRNTLALNI